MVSTLFDKRPWPHRPCASIVLAIALTLVVSGCASATPETVGAAQSSPTESWQCRNDLEVRCGAGGCETTTGAGFTPMSVNVEDSGAMSVCAYSGCWEGVGEVVQSENFLVLIGHRLPFSTSPGPESAKADIIVAIDRTDRVATLKAGEFAHPLLCEKTAVPAK